MTTARAHFEALLSRGDVTLHVDTRHVGVRLPPSSPRNGIALVTISRASDRPFSFDETGITDWTLPEFGEPFECVIPWASIVAMNDDAHVVTISSTAVAEQNVALAVDNSHALTAEKRGALAAMRWRGDVFVHLDPRSRGVAVPAWLSDRPQLVLQLPSLASEWGELRETDDGITASLVFNRAPVPVVLTWEAVYAFVAQDGEVRVFPPSIPRELRPSATSPSVAHPKLQVIKGGRG